MGKLISVPVWVDGSNHFLFGELLAVDSQSIVVGTVPKPAGYNTFPQPDSPMVNTLFVKDPNLGGLYLNVTLAQWQDMIKESSQSPAPTIATNVYTIAAASNTLTDTALNGATLIVVMWNGVGQNIEGMLSGDILTFASELQVDDTVQVTYFIS